MVHHMITRSKGKNTSPLTPSLSNEKTDCSVDIPSYTVKNKFVSFMINSYNIIKNDIKNELIEYDIDFDESSRAWMRNKRKIGNGEYKYK